MKLRSILVLFVILLALGAYWSFFRPSEPLPEPETQLYVWLIEMEEIENIVIRLPRENQSQAFVKEEDRSWHFDDPERSAVDMQRWGGGIPLLLSGPGTDRIISENTSDEKLAEFGLIQPQMELVLTLENGDILNITVGDRTPNGISFYVQAPGTRDVALVDYTWFEVLERLVKDPPYPLPETE